ncbi:MAG: hypothetical protein ACJ8C4_09785 [Gemmataceae bacterium]
MIELSRKLARRIHGVLRRVFRKPYQVAPVIAFAAGRDGLIVQARHTEIAVEYRHAGSFPRADLVVSMETLAAVAGSDETVVTMRPGAAGQVVATWTDRDVPQVTAFLVPDAKGMPAFPDLPEQWTANPPALLAAIDEASRTTATDSVRFALQRIQLNAKAGKVVGTDSKNLFIAGGFDFGFQEDVLIPRIMAFNQAELGETDLVEIGRTENHVAIRCGPWTCTLAIDTVGRYPDVESVIPRRSANAATCRFDAEDSAFLLRALPRLPGKESPNPITLALNGRVVLRSRATDQPQTTELVLARSACGGPPSLLNLNRDHLHRALSLGFRELTVVNPDRPLVFRDERRTYVTMPLTAKDALTPSADVLQVNSANMPSTAFKPKPEKHMATPSTNGVDHEETSRRQRSPSVNKSNGRVTLATLITEAQRLKESAREMFSKANRLTGTLKRHRKQARLTASTLRSLKQLHVIDA